MYGGGHEDNGRMAILFGRKQLEYLVFPLTKTVFVKFVISRLSERNIEMVTTGQTRIFMKIIEILIFI